MKNRLLSLSLLAALLLTAGVPALAAADPVTTPDPVTTAEPEITPDPEPTPEPEVTPEPETTPEPEITPEPEVTPEPETTPEPEITPDPEPTPEPEVTPEPETTSEPDGGVSPAAEDLDAQLAQIRADGGFNQTPARSMLAMINSLRTGPDAWYWNEDNSDKVWLSGLQELRYDYDLEQIAMQRAVELVLTWGHTRPNGELCFTATYNGTRSYGENIAKNYDSAQSAFVAWSEADKDYDGQGHRRNMLNEKFTSVGIACFVYKGTVYWVQEFGYSNSGAAATEPDDTGYIIDSGVCGAQGDNLTWTLDFDNVLTISGQGDMADYDSQRMEWYYAEKAVIEPGVTGIGRYGFLFCMRLQSVSIPDTVSAVRPGAFYGCRQLTEITFPGSVTSIGSGVLSGCEQLQKVTVVNKNCSINAQLGSEMGVAGQTVLCGYRGSDLEQFAGRCGFTFEPLIGGPGDLQQDGAIDMLDVRALFGSVRAGGAGTLPDDLTHDGKTDLRDVTKLYQYVVGKTNVLC